MDGDFITRTVSEATFHPDFAKGLNNFEKTFPDLIYQKTIIYSGQTLPSINNTSIINWRDR